MENFIKALKAIITLNIKDEDNTALEKNVDILIQHHSDGFQAIRKINNCANELVFESINNNYSHGAIYIIKTFNLHLLQDFDTYRDKAVNSHDYKTLSYLQEAYGKVNKIEINNLFNTYLRTSRKSSRMPTFKALISLITDFNLDKKTISCNDIIERIALCSLYEELTFLLDNEYKFPFNVIERFFEHLGIINSNTESSLTFRNNKNLTALVSCIYNKHWNNINTTNKLVILQSYLIINNITPLEFLSTCKDKHKITCLLLI